MDPNDTESSEHSFDSDRTIRAPPSPGRSQPYENTWVIYRVSHREFCNEQDEDGTIDSRGLQFDPNDFRDVPNTSFSGFIPWRVHKQRFMQSSADSDYETRTIAATREPPTLTSSLLEFCLCLSCMCCLGSLACIECCGNCGSAILRCNPRRRTR